MENKKEINEIIRLLGNIETQLSNIETNTNDSAKETEEIRKTLGVLPNEEITVSESIREIWIKIEDIYNKINK